MTGVAATSLPVVGYQREPVPNTFFRQSAEATRLGILLPGHRHTVDRPELHYAERVLLERGADVLRVEYAYWKIDFMSRPEPERDAWLRADVEAAGTQALAERTYGRTTLVGKSLGTLAMGHLLALEAFQKSVCVWLTPLLTVRWLVERMEQLHPQSLIVVGTADPFYDPAIQDHLQAVTGGRVLVLPGADHSLEVPESVPAPLLALGQIVSAMEQFIA
ncbi:MAG: alpha/beta family hydrolase [Anaerolineales bacterium]|jgi:hypothetical protein